MGCHLASNVRNLHLDFTFIEFTDTNLDDTTLERDFQHTLESLDWGPLRVLLPRLRSLAMNLKLGLNMRMEKWEMTANGRVTRSRSERQVRNGDVQRYTTLVEDVVRARLSLAADEMPRLELLVSFPRR